MLFNSNMLLKSCVFTSHNQFCLSCKVAAAALSFLRIISPLLLSISPKVEYFWPTLLDDECSSPSFLCDAMNRRQTTITESWLLVVLRKVAAVASSLLFFFLLVNFGPLMYFVEDGISEFPSTPHCRATQLMELFLLAPKGDLCSPNHSPWCQPSEQRGNFGLWTKNLLDYEIKQLLPLSPWWNLVLIWWWKISSVFIWLYYYSEENPIRKLSTTLRRRVPKREREGFWCSFDCSVLHLW